MVTGLVEVGRRKCHQYWPNQVGVPEQFGSFILELISEQSQARRLIFLPDKPDIGQVNGHTGYSPVGINTGR